MLSGTSRQTCTINDGVSVLKLVEAARRSSSEDKVIEIADMP
jgi:hypothetical protein